jgi:hypothetical protein
MTDQAGSTPKDRSTVLPHILGHPGDDALAGSCMACIERGQQFGGDFCARGNLLRTWLG